MKLRRRMWGTWEELILGGAVVRHGTHNWDIIADEVRIRAHSAPAHLYTPQECQSRFEGIQEEYSENNSWYEELRKRRVAELKRELAKSEDSIGSLQNKIQTLTRERETDSNSGRNTSQTESQYPAEDADGRDSSSKEDSKDGISAGSFTEKTVRAQKNEDDANVASVSVHKNSPKMEFSENTCREKLESSENTCRVKLESSENTCMEKLESLENTCRVKLESSENTCMEKLESLENTCRVKLESSENTCMEKLESLENTCREKLESLENTCREKFGCEGLGIGLKILKRKRGKRKRKGCNVMEGSVGCSDTLSSAPSTDREGSTEGSIQDTKLLSEDHDGASGKDDSHLYLAAVMDSIMKEKDVSIFRSRLESQRRVRYKKMIRRHVDFCNINLRIGNGSISSSKELLRDLYLLVNNALVYYPKKSLEHKFALVLRDLVKKTFGQSSTDSPSNLSQSSSNDVGEIPNVMLQQNAIENAEDASGKEDDETPSPKESEVAVENREATPVTKESSDKGSCKVDDMALESPVKKERVTGRNARGGQRGGRKRRQETTNRGRKRTRR